MNYRRGSTVANTTIVSVPNTASGLNLTRGCAGVFNGDGTTHLLVDVLAYLTK